MRRAYIGMIIGVIAAVIWHWLGWEALVWSIGFGLIGYRRRLDTGQSGLAHQAGGKARAPIRSRAVRALASRPGLFGRRPA